MIEATGLSKRYDDGTLALDDLNLRVAKGEIYCLLGANGAGKTTTINLFLGFIQPTAGSVRVRDVDVAAEPLETKRYQAYLSEKVALYPNLSARQNIEFFLNLRPPTVKRAGYEDLLAKMGLPSEALDQPVRGFSKGMAQKVGLSIAILSEVPALLLDEPMSGLDPKTASELVTSLLTLRDGGKAILASTHDIFRARTMADRVGILKEGRKVFEASAAELRGCDLEEIYLSYMSDGERG